jgi:hypothetical protein
MTVRVIKPGDYLAGLHWFPPGQARAIEWAGGPAVSLEWALSVETPCGPGIVARPSTRYIDREYCEFSR